MAGTSIAELTATVTADTSDFDSKMASAGQKVDDLSGKAESSSAKMQTAGVGLTAIGVAGTAAFASVVGAAGDFESVMNNVQALTGATGSEMEGLSGLALQIGQDTAFSAQEGAQAIAELGKSGLPIPDIMEGAAMATADLAAAGEIDMARAAEVMGAAMNTFGIEGSKAADVGDVLAAGANKSAASIDSLAMGMAQAGAGAAALGIPLEDTVATLAAFADRGMQGSDAGTSMKTMLNSLTPASKPAIDAFHELGLMFYEVDEAGNTIQRNAFFNEEGNFIGMAGAADVLHDSLKDLSQEERTIALERLFGADAGRAAAIMFDMEADAAAGAGDSLADYISAVQPAGQATEVANAKMAGMNGAIEALMGSVDTLKIQFGIGLTPVIEAAAEGLAVLVNAFGTLPAPVKTIITAITGLVGILGVGLGGAILIVPKILAFQQAISGLGVAAKLASVAFGPVGIAIAAIGLAVVAYQTNFLGFADAVNFVAGAVRDALMPALDAIGGTLATLMASFEAFRAQGLDPFHAAMSALANTFPGLIGVISPIVSVVDTVMLTFQRLRDSFNAFVAQGFTPLQAAFEALRDVFPSFTGAIDTAEALINSFIETLRGIGTGLLDAVTALSQGDIAGALQGLFDAALASISGFIELARIMWAGLFQAFAAIDWGAVSAAIATGLQAISTALQTWLQEQSDKLMAGFNQAWAAVAAAVAPAWAIVEAAIAGAWAAIQAAIQTALTTVQTAITDAWAAMGAAVGPAWEAVTTAVTTAWTNIQTAVTTALTTVQTAIGEAWTAIQTTVTTAQTAIQEVVSNAWVTIQNDIALRVDAIRLAITTAWETIQTFLGEKATAIQTLITDAWTAIQTVVTDAQAAIGTVISDAWIAITDFLGTAMEGLLTIVTTTFEAIATTITTQATAAKDGLINTLTAMKDEAINTLSGLKDGIVGLFADAGTWLLQAGKDIIGGLIDGILSMGGQVADAVASVIPTDIGMPTLDFLGGGGGGSTGDGGGGRPGPGNARALGGPVLAMEPYWVNERGPELFVPAVNGRILSHRDSMQAVGGGSGGTSIVIETLNLPGVRNAQQFAAELLDLTGDHGRQRLVAAGRG